MAHYSHGCMPPIARQQADALPRFWRHGLLWLLRPCREHGISALAALPALPAPHARHTATDGQKPERNPDPHLGTGRQTLRALCLCTPDRTVGRASGHQPLRCIPLLARCRRTESAASLFIAASKADSDVPFICSQTLAETVPADETFFIDRLKHDFDWDLTHREGARAWQACPGWADRI